MVYIFEGLPGSGKTTLINAVSKDMESYSPIILNEFLPESQGDQTDISFYINNEKLKSLRMEQYESKLVLTDRYWPSTAIYCSASSNGENIDELMSIHKINHKFDLFNKVFYIYLYVSPDTSIRRAHTPEMPNMWNTPSFAKRAHKLYDLLYQKIDSVFPEIIGKAIIDMENETNQGATKIIASMIDENK